MYTIYNARFALLEGMEMTESSSARMGIVAFLAILTVSAGTMLWLFWRFPLTTAIVTLGVLAALGVLARLARSIDVELKDLDRTEQSV
jgi:CHASE2 domain-containing sensor protein